jgi:glycosyltransferase involved in cell wall biosynthesis
MREGLIYKTICYYLIFPPGYFIMLREQPEQARCLGLAAWQRVRENFSLEQMAAAIADLYMKAISGV